MNFALLMRKHPQLILVVLYGIALISHFEFLHENVHPIYMGQERLSPFLHEEIPPYRRNPPILVDLLLFFDDGLPRCDELASAKQIPPRHVPSHLHKECLSEDKEQFRVPANEKPRLHVAKAGRDSRPDSKLKIHLLFYFFYNLC